MGSSYAVSCKVCAQMATMLQLACALVAPLPPALLMTCLPPLLRPTGLLLLLVPLLPVFLKACVPPSCCLDRWGMGHLVMPGWMQWIPACSQRT